MALKVAKMELGRPEKNRQQVVEWKQIGASTKRPKQRQRDEIMWYEVSH